MATIKLDFKIEKQKVFGEVEKLTAYFGAKVAPDGSGYEQIALTEAQYEVLDNFWRIATEAITDVVKPYISSVTWQSNGDIDYVLSMPSNWNEHLKDDIVDTAKSYVEQYVAGMWFRIATDQSASVDNEEKHIDDAVALIGQLKRKLYDRVRPKRPCYDDPVPDVEDDPVVDNPTDVEEETPSEDDGGEGNEEGSGSDDNPNGEFTPPSGEIDAPDREIEITPDRNLEIEP